MTQSTSSQLQPLYVTLVTGAVDNVSRLIVTDLDGKEIGILGGVDNVAFSVCAASECSILNLTIRRPIGLMERGCAAEE